MFTPEVQFRQCSADDAATLAIVGAATFLEAFAGRLPGEAILGHCARNHTEAAYARFFAQPGTHAWIAEALPGGAPVGYALVTVPDFSPDLVRPGDAELKRIYVFSRFYRSASVVDESHTASEQDIPRTAGQQLMNLAIAAASSQDSRRLLLGVHRENARALAFYKRNRFKPVGVRTFQVGPSTFDDLVLARQL